MMARDRKAPGGTSATATAVVPATTPAPLRNGQEAPGPRKLPWQELFQGFSADQQADLLVLAARQGLIYAHQVPAQVNGIKSKPTQENLPQLQILSRLLAGACEGFTPVQVQTRLVVDEGLDQLQREAVFRALDSPDIFLLQGLPGTGKSRVLAEILTQAAHTGLRVLFLAQHASALDVVLQRLGGREAVLALRFLETGETVASVPVALRDWTLAGRRRSFLDCVRQQADRALAETEENCRRRQQEEAAWEELSRQAVQDRELVEKLRHVREHLARQEGDVQREAAAVSADSTGPFAAELFHFQQSQQEAHAGLNRESQLLIQEQQTARLDLEQACRTGDRIRPLAEAKKCGRWWKLAWWQALFGGNVVQTLAELDQRRQTLEMKIQELAGRQAELDNRQKLNADQFQAKRQHILQGEIGRRRQEWLLREAELVRAQESLGNQWSAQVQGLERHCPESQTRKTLEATRVSWLRKSAQVGQTQAGQAGSPGPDLEPARSLWHQQCRQDEQALQFARRWSHYLAETGELLGPRVREWANVLAGTLAAFAGDPTIAEAGPFDLLVVEEADLLTEADLVKLARLAPRWVLVAESHGPAGANLPGAGPRVLAPASLRLGTFQKLWQTLHCDSHRLHYSWSREGERLCCTLRPVEPKDRAYLEVERVADFPEIELRILAAPKAPPLLAQVIFPPAIPVDRAKDFIYRELQEVTVMGLGRGGWLREDEARFHFHLSPLPIPEALGLDLERGLREWVAPATGHTCRIDFDGAAGWTRPQVDQWLQRHLHLRDLGRTALLQVPYRMTAPLARTVGNILFAGEYLPPSVGLTLRVRSETQNGPGELHAEREAHVEFIAVPPSRKEDARKADDRRKTPTHLNGAAGLPREGAGLEQDLAAVRIADRLPADLRADLPRRGFVNFLEAQALIRRLEALAQQPDSMSGPIAVLALYDAQVELLRRLCARSEVLARQAVLLEIGLPTAFRQREFDTVLVSLTRSHGHRAVPFGERETDLALALTRGRRRLILCGDPGALVKRASWQGPLEHLDAAAADLEARRIAALVRFLQDGKNQELKV